MKIAVVSDSHENLEYIDLFLEKIKDQGIDEVFHLGDNYPDAEPIIKAGYVVYRVPGTWTPYYLNSMIDNRVIEERLGWKILMSHTPERHFNDLPSDPDPQEIVSSGEVDVFLHGHTHHPKAEKLENGTVVINPGHTKSDWDRGYTPTFAILTLDETQLDVEIHSLLEKKIFQKCQFCK